jgi:hypothetical protein
MSLEQEQQEVIQEESSQDSNPINIPIKSIEELENELAFIPPEILRQQHESDKPDISWLHPAIDKDGNFIPSRGTYVVIERSNLLVEGNPWLDTKVYRLVTEPSPDGFIRLYDCIEQHCAMINWKSGLERGYVFKLPPLGKNPETLFQSSGKRRKHKKFVQQAIKLDEEKDTKNPQENIISPKRGRGRPRKNPLPTT